MIFSIPFTPCILISLSLTLYAGTLAPTNVWAEGDSKGRDDLA